MSRSTRATIWSARHFIAGSKFNDLAAVRSAQLDLRTVNINASTTGSLREPARLARRFTARRFAFRQIGARPGCWPTFGRRFARQPSARRSECFHRNAKTATERVACAADVWFSFLPYRGIAAESSARLDKSNRDAFSSNRRHCCNFAAPAIAPNGVRNEKKIEDHEPSNIRFTTDAEAVRMETLPQNEVDAVPGH